MPRDFQSTFAACVTLVNEGELGETAGGHRIVARALDGRYALYVDSRIVLEGTAFDIATAFAQACAVKRQDAQRRIATPPRSSSHVRLRALADTPTLPSPVLAKRR